MKVLIAVASKYGSTLEIAEAIANGLRTEQMDADVREAKKIKDLTGYDAFVVGSATYFGSWLKEATTFVERNQAVMANRPVWLFSSGPIGTDMTDDEGRDVREAAEPKQIAEFTESIRPRDHRVFFGKLDRDKLGFTHRMIASLPAFPGAEGDFRDWDEIRSWSHEIATSLRTSDTVVPASMDWSMSDSQ